MKTEDIIHGTLSSTAVPELQPNVQRFVNRFHAAGKRTVSELLECAAVIAEAHAYLGELLLIEFYQHIRLERDGSTAKKMRKVGENKTRLEPYIERLPNNWTTLYHLVTLKQHEFQKLADSDVLNQFVTLEKIKDQFRTSADVSRQKSQRLVIDLIKVKEGKAEFAKKLKSLLSEYNVLSAETQAPTLDQFIEQAAEGETHA